MTSTSVCSPTATLLFAPFPEVPSISIHDLTFLTVLSSSLIASGLAPRYLPVRLQISKTQCKHRRERPSLRGYPPHVLVDRGVLRVDHVVRRESARGGDLDVVDLLQELVHLDGESRGEGQGVLLGETFHTVTSAESKRRFTIRLIRLTLTFVRRLRARPATKNRDADGTYVDGDEADSAAGSADGDLDEVLIGSQAPAVLLERKALRVHHSVEFPVELDPHAELFRRARGVHCDHRVRLARLRRGRSGGERSSDVRERGEDEQQQFAARHLQEENPHA